MYGGIIVPREEEIHPIINTEKATNTYYVYRKGGDTIYNVYREGGDTIYNVYGGIIIPRDEEISRIIIINFA